MESVRTMLIQAELPQRLWVEELTAAVYLHNRSPTKSLLKMIPLEAWSGVKQDISHLRTFGCIAYAHFPKYD